MTVGGAWGGGVGDALPVGSGALLPLLIALLVGGASLRHGDLDAVVRSLRRLRGDDGRAREDAGNGQGCRQTER
jgi:hypothetical protein